METSAHSSSSDPTTDVAPPLGSGQMFDVIASRYDLLNRLLSLGLDGSWRQRAVAALDLEEQGRVIDLATGTGDLAIAIARAYPQSSVHGIDPSAGMLEIATKKARETGLEDRVDFAQGDAQELALEDSSFDACSIAFGIRNVPDRDRALREMARVVRPGGRVVILELSIPRNGLMAWGARLQVDYVVPLLGRILSGPEAYRHLRDSMHAFPDSHQFSQDMANSGLEVDFVEVLAPGVCTLFVARTPARVEGA